MQTPPSPQPDLNQVLTPAAPPVEAPATPTVKPVLVTEQQLEGELGNILQSAGKTPRRGLKIILWLMVAALVIGGLVYVGLNQGWFGTSTDTTSLDNSSSLDSADTTSLDSAPPTTNTATESTTDLTTAAGRDAARRERLNLFVTAARAAAEKQVNLPITTAPIKLSDNANATVTEIRQLLTDQSLTTAQIDEYLLDPTPDKYYFGYDYDGQLLTLTAVLEAGGTDCTKMTTANGEICLLKKTVDL